MQKKCLAAVLSAIILLGSMACTPSAPPSPDTEESTTVQNTIENMTEEATDVESEPETEYDWSKWEPSEGVDMTELTVAGGQYTGGEEKMYDFTYSFKNNPEYFVFYQADGKGDTVSLGSGRVSAVYLVPIFEDDTVATYSANIKVGAIKDNSTNTQYIGLRLPDGNNDPHTKCGLWFAIREDEIGLSLLRSGKPSVSYMKIKAEGVNFKTSRMLYIEDDMKTDTITVSANNDSGEKVAIAVIKIVGTKVSLYHPGENTPVITDAFADVPAKGYIRFWGGFLQGTTTLSQLTASGVIHETTKVVLEANMLASKDILPDTWVSVDDEGRVSGYTYREANAKKVGMFYFIRSVGDAGPIRDHTKAFLEGGGEKLIEVIPQDGAHFWAEPYFGYYQTNDEWVLRKHAMQLSAAGVDFVYFDVSNADSHADGYMPLLKVWSEMRAEGYDTPQVMFLCGNVDANAKASFTELWLDLYSKGLYEDLWFKYEDKPLIFMPRNVYAGLKKEQQEFFNFRQSWAVVTEADSWYLDRRGRECWPWATFYPQKPGLSRKGDLEQMVVMCGFWSNGSFGTNAGRSYAGGVQPPSLGISDFCYSLLETTTDKGLAFEEQFNYAIEQDPGIIMLTGWNEWWAARQSSSANGGVGTLIANTYEVTNDGKWTSYYYWDAFNPEYSRDLEPVKGLFNDNYYYQMIQNIREYKGSRAPLAAFGQRPIDMAGVQSQWDIVGPEFRDYVGDTAHRDHMSYVGQLHYTNTTGRNDLATAKVSRFGDDLWFYVECAADITAPEGTNWMNLFINADGKQETGWYGYDYVINRDRDGGTCSISKFSDGKWEMTEIGRADYVVNGKYMVIKLDAKALGLGDTFDFKWADNSVDSGDIMQFVDLGDTAPNDRFNYRYTTTETEQVLPETLTADMVVLKAGSYYAFVEGKMVRLDETTTKATFFGDEEHAYLPFEFAKSVGLAKDGDKTYNHYGVAYVDITSALETCGKTVSRTEELLVLADKALTEDEMLILYRALY